ncbi:MAG: hypothetical protein KAI47_19250, partial [Deltaproteobacteria bacterium]|nr:hypothetical protein [Deltaproteobacteria bacterium]
VALAGGCTQANPNYVTVFDQALGDAAISGDSPVADLRGGGEVLPPPQDGRIVDLPKVDHTLPVDVALPPPDLGVCTRPEDCDDGLSCTDDRCALGVCVHDLRAGSCAIDGVCYGVNESDPKNSCQRCAPGSASHVWTVASDGSQCKDDGLWCTVDRCQTGLCAHVQDQGCVVNGTCVKAGTPDVGNECLVCIPSAATVGYTFVDGEICGAKKQGICVKRACRHLVPTVVPTAGKNVVDGSLRAVTYQPTSKEIWAGGTLVRRGAGGSLLAMGILTHLNASSSVKVEVVVDPVRSLSNRLAVQGRVFSHYDISTGNWTKEAGLQTALGRITREGVWGTSLGQDEIYYLTGHVTAQKRGVVRCKRAASGMWTCVDHG